MSVRGSMAGASGWSDRACNGLQFELDDVSMCLRMPVSYKFIIIERTLIE